MIGVPPTKLQAGCCTRKMQLKCIVILIWNFQFIQGTGSPIHEICKCTSARQAHLRYTPDTCHSVHMGALPGWQFVRFYLSGSARYPLWDSGTRCLAVQPRPRRSSQTSHHRLWRRTRWLVLHHQIIGRRVITVQRKEERRRNRRRRVCRYFAFSNTSLLLSELSIIPAGDNP